VLDHVERRRFLVKPAREDPVPAPVRLLDVDLDERAGELLVFPWSGRLARPKPDDHVLPPHRLAGMERHGLDDPVALVEHSKHRHALGHRRDSTLPICGRGRLLGRRQRSILALITLAARGKGKGSEQQCRAAGHAYSGIQGS
jgi:hypothetical protein